MTAPRSGNFDQIGLTFAEETYTVSELGREVKELLGQAFPSVWVVGDVTRYRPSANGHHYFDLVEKGEGDQVVGTLSAVVWRGEFARIRGVLDRAGQRLADGLKIRCRVGLDFYSPSGRLSAQVKEIDPSFTLGDLERRRRETIAALEAAGLLAANKARELVALPLRIGLVTSQGSAAYHDFLATLRESGYGFQVVFVHSSVQGFEAERELVSALALLASANVDCVVLIRGGGSRSDLAVFDNRAVAEAVARSPHPVLSGLGHEIDQSVADLAAHTAFKTPTKVAEFLIARLQTAEWAIETRAKALAGAAFRPVAQGRERLLGAAARFGAMRHRVARAGARLESTAGAVARLARARVRAAAAESRKLAPRFAAAGRRALGRIDERLRHGERLAASFAIDRTLRRGFSVTRTKGGELVRRAQDVRTGEILATRLAEGAVTSRVEES